MIQRDRAAILTLLDGIQAAMELMLGAIIRYRKDVLMQRVDHIDEHGYVHWKRETCTETPSNTESSTTSAVAVGENEVASAIRRSRK